MIYILKYKNMPWGSYVEMLWQGIYYFNKKTVLHLKNSSILSKDISKPV